MEAAWKVHIEAALGKSVPKPPGAEGGDARAAAPRATRNPSIPLPKEPKPPLPPGPPPNRRASTPLTGPGSASSGSPALGAAAPVAVPAASLESQARSESPVQRAIRLFGSPDSPTRPDSPQLMARSASGDVAAKPPPPPPVPAAASPTRASSRRTFTSVFESPDFAARSAVAVSSPGVPHQGAQPTMAPPVMEEDKRPEPSPQPPQPVSPVSASAPVASSDADDPDATAKKKRLLAKGVRLPSLGSCALPNARVRSALLELLSTEETYVQNLEILVRSPSPLPEIAHRPVRAAYTRSADRSLCQPGRVTRACVVRAARRRTADLQPTWLRAPSVCAGAMWRRWRSCSRTSCPSSACTSSCCRTCASGSQPPPPALDGRRDVALCRSLAPAAEANSHSEADPVIGARRAHGTVAFTVFAVPVGDVLLNFAPFFKMYTTYVTHHGTTTKFLHHTVPRNAKKASKTSVCALAAAKRR
jgi:hypothetical protein